MFGVRAVVGEECEVVELAEVDVEVLEGVLEVGVPAAVPPTLANAGAAVLVRAIVLKNVAMMIRSGKASLSSACGVS